MLLRILKQLHLVSFFKGLPIQSTFTRAPSQTDKIPANTIVFYPMDIFNSPLRSNTSKIKTCVIVYILAKYFLLLKYLLL
jgi:hypothetical protein